MNVEFISALALGAVILLAPGCGRSPTAPSSSAPEPAHPAMRAPPESSSPRTSLPPDHPAIPSSAEKGPSEPPLPAEGGERELAVGPVALTAPEGWIRMPARRFTIAVFALPRAEGDSEDGQITVSVVGGDNEQNIARWRGQFKENPPDQREEQTVAGMRAITVRLSGTFTGGGGPMTQSSAEKPDWKMWGTIIEVPGLDNPLFLKATGPGKTMNRWNESFGEFLNSLRNAK